MKRLPVVALAALVALGLTACGTIDGDKLADEIASGLNSDLQQIDVTIDTVDCPDDVESETGATFDCAATTDKGDELPVNVEVTDGENGDVSYEIQPDVLRGLAFGNGNGN